MLLDQTLIHDIHTFLQFYSSVFWLSFMTHNPEKFDSESVQNQITFMNQIKTQMN